MRASIPRLAVGRASAQKRVPVFFFFFTPPNPKILTFFAFLHLIYSHHHQMSYNIRRREHFTIVVIELRAQNIVDVVCKKHKFPEKTKNEKVFLSKKNIKINQKQIFKQLLNVQNVLVNIYFVFFVAFISFVIVEFLSTFSTIYIINIKVIYNENNVINFVNIFNNFNYSKFNVHSISKLNEIAKNRNLISHNRFALIHYYSFKKFVEQNLNDEIE